MSGRKKFLVALKERLGSIKEQNGYPLTVQKIFLNDLTRLSIATPKIDCPAIEIIQDTESYDIKHQHMIISSSIFLRLVHKEHTSDEDMEVFKSAVIRCLYKDSYGTGRQVALAPLLSAEGGFTNSVIRLKECVSDLGMIEANRVYVVHFIAEYHINIYDF